MNTTKEQLKKLAAQIGMMELQRKQGIYVPMAVINSKKREFKKLSDQYMNYKLFSK